MYSIFYIKYIKLYFLSIIIEKGSIQNPIFFI